MARGDRGTTRTQADSDPCQFMEAVDYSGGDVELDQPAFIRCDVAGTIVAKPIGSVAVTLNLAAGEIPPVVFDTVYQSGSTATVHAMW